MTLDAHVTGIWGGQIGGGVGRFRGYIGSRVWGLGPQKYVKY